MPYVCVVINVPNESIKSLNDQCQFSTKAFESVQGIANLLQGIEAGAVAASVQITTRDTDPAVATHGSGSQQNSFSLL